MIGVACDTSLAERWRRMAASLPSDSERAAALRLCASELVPSHPFPSIVLTAGAQTQAVADAARAST